MAAKDIYHSNVKNALAKDGWTITHDPLPLRWGKNTLQVDLGAERLLAAEKGSSKIAVEVKSFLSRSRIDDFEDALGQMVLYGYLLRESEPDRDLFLAIRNEVYDVFISQPHVSEFLELQGIRLLVFDSRTEEVLLWINRKDTEK